MNLHARLYTPQDYATVRPWWAEHGEAAVPENVLPELGVVIEDGGAPVAVAWLYLDTTRALAWVAYPLTRGGLAPFDAQGALAGLLGACEAAARDRGRGVLILCTDKRSLHRLSIDAGYLDQKRTMLMSFKSLEAQPCPS